MKPAAQEKKKKNEKGSLALYVSSTKEWRSKASTA
jgi:hypothetical protein